MIECLHNFFIVLCIQYCTVLRRVITVVNSWTAQAIDAILTKAREQLRMIREEEALAMDIAMQQDSDNSNPSS